MFKIRVYEKRKHPAEPFFWVVSITGLVMCGVWFLLDDVQKSLIPSFIFYIVLALFGLGGVMRIILFWHDHGPIGDVSYLMVDDDSIGFLDTRLQISRIDSVLIRLNDDRIQYSRSRNNYFEIKMQNGVVYKFGILINDSKDEVQVDGIVRILKSKITNFAYEGYL